MSEKIQVHRFTVISTVSRDTITVATYADGAKIAVDLYTTTMGVEAAEKDALFRAEKFGVLTKDYERFYELIPTPPPPPQNPPPAPLPPPPPSPKVKKEGKWYLPKTRYRKAKSTNGGEFVVKATKEPYTGQYIETFKKQYFAGSSPEQLGEELEKIRVRGDFDLIGEQLIALTPGLLLALKGILSKRKITASERARGVTTRYFIQEPVTGKIVEVTRPIYEESKSKLPNRKYVEVPWKVTGPAEDLVINGYPFTGAATVNRNALIQAEKSMPGILQVIKDYSYLVEEPPLKQAQTPQSYSTVIQDPEISLENSRKANFDTRK